MDNKPSLKIEIEDWEFHQTEDNMSASTSTLMRNGRIVMSEYQKKMLKQSYEQNKYPSKNDKMYLSNACGLPLMVVSNWFPNKRRKDEIVEPVGVRNGRTLLTKNQKKCLEDAYVANKFPTKKEKLFMSQTCDLPYLVIHNWFQNRRRKNSFLSPKIDRF